jgi:hypothetical protein
MWGHSGFNTVQLRFISIIIELLLAEGEHLFITNNRCVQGEGVRERERGKKGGIVKEGGKEGGRWGRIGRKNGERGEEEKRWGKRKGECVEGGEEKVGKKGGSREGGEENMCKEKV